MQRAFLEPSDATYVEVATGQFESTNTNPKTVVFDEPVTTRFVKLTSLSAVGGQAWAHIAELQVRGAAAEAPALLDDPAVEPRVWVSPSSVPVGGSVLVTGGGFAPGEVTVEAGGESVTAVADGFGFVATELTLPAAGQVTVTVSQGDLSASASAEVTAAPATAPVIADLADVSVEVGETVSVQASATGTAPIVFSASGLPAGVAIDPASGVISGEPEAAGSSSVTVTATNEAGSDSTSFTMTVAEAPVVDTTAPAIAAVGPVTGKQGTALSVTFEASDESLPLTYSATGLPAGVSINPSTGVISGTPTGHGVSTATVTVTDAAGNTASTTVRFTIAATAYEFVPTAPYTKPGVHFVNGRQWLTTCEPYSQTQRCRTDIWASVVKKTDTGFVIERGWAFNNLTYLPYMTRAQWASNPLGTPGYFLGTDNAQWRTECDTAATGANACRTYRLTTVYAAHAKPGGGYTFSQSNEWVFNNMVMFRPW
ncbi:hypothetical protein RPIT_10990 [Tessaracoccus flavus]|uniref:Uncharacterized protein n=1 Tax=Tessaracoccus flavus TaxID=1610493 RepID=A0A1Q2CGT3_9ACTN|nr:hypothetical protein RPIT_10990 [Tessaracoccus flavus]